MKSCFGGPPSRASRQVILLEAIQEQNRATIEAIFASRQRLERKMDDMQRDLSLRIERIVAIAKNSTEDIRNKQRIDPAQHRGAGETLGGASAHRGDAR